MRSSRAAKLSWIAATLVAAVLAPPLAAGEANASPTPPGATPTRRARTSPLPAPMKAPKKSAAKPKKKKKKKASPPPKPSKNARPRKPGSAPGEPDEAVRRAIAGTSRDRAGESPELKALREIDLTLFPSARAAESPVFSDGSSLLPGRGEVEVVASGLPPTPGAGQRDPAAPAADLSWLKLLAMPDIPVRWDARVIRYLEYFKNNPRGRSLVVNSLKRSGRYAGAIRRTLREQKMPEDVLWLALVESAFNPEARSPAGAAGLWQFMPEGARIYGLTVDRWVDERLDPERSTLAAARFLSDLHKRFGSWELAFAAYNMGYGGLLAAIRKYNTNDFWELSRFEAGVPLETALYVPKIVAMAIVAKNRAVFGVEDLELDPAVPFDKVAVGPGVSLRTVASAAGASIAELEDLNPQLLASRTPPTSPGQKPARVVVRVPAGTGLRASKAVDALAARESKVLEHLLRWGESLDDVADRSGVGRLELRRLNGVRYGEVVRPGTVVLVPERSGEAGATAQREKPVVVVPSEAFRYAGRRRVFYRVMPGDTIRDVAQVFSVSPDEVCRWNAIDPGASLHDGMTLQVFIPRALRLASALVLEEEDARVLPAGSEAFFAHFEALKGRARVELAAKPGDTWQGLARRHGLSIGMMERINQRSRNSALEPGEKVVVYVAKPAAPTNPAPADPAPGEEGGDEVVVASTEDQGGTDGAEDDAVRPASLVVKKDAPAPSTPAKPAPDAPKEAAPGRDAGAEPKAEDKKPSPEGKKTPG